MNEFKLQLLLDDLDGAEDGFRLSYGFSLLISKDQNNILFDTGTKPNDMIHNLNRAGYTPIDLTAVILSHNHYDHTNGLSSLLPENPDLPLYIHKKWNEPTSYKGDNLSQYNLKTNSTARELTEITSNIYLSNCYLSSDYGGIAEHACFLSTDTHLVLITGCCHPGLTKFLQDRDILGFNKNLKLIIIGGFHGFKFSNQEAENVNKDLEAIYCCHCTQCVNTYKMQFGDKVKILKVGAVLNID